MNFVEFIKLFIGLAIKNSLKYFCFHAYLCSVRSNGEQRETNRQKMNVCKQLVFVLSSHAEQNKHGGRPASLWRRNKQHGNSHKNKLCTKIKQKIKQPDVLFSLKGCLTTFIYSHSVQHDSLQQYKVIRFCLGQTDCGSRWVGLVIRVKSSSSCTSINEPWGTHCTLFTKGCTKRRAA